MKMRLSNKGIALPLVLWTITVLMSLVFSFALATRAEMRMSSSFRTSVEKKFLAEAGIERALLELNYLMIVGQTKDSLETWKTDNSIHKEAIGKASYEVGIMDESGKISINALNDSTAIVLRNLLIHLGVSPEASDIIVDSILDWKDEDNLHRLNGAEDDYYLSLPTPYKARNGNFRSPEELLLVKGMTDDIYFGKGKTKGLCSFITVFSSHMGISLRTASKDVLESLPGMTEALVDSLISYREATAIWNLSEIRNLLGSVFQQMRPFTNAASQKTYTITSTGYKEGEKVGYSVTATLSFSSGSYKYLYYKSPSWVE
jgi:general secretion pathway protein K